MFNRLMKMVNTLLKRTFYSKDHSHTERQFLLQNYNRYIGAGRLDRVLQSARIETDKFSYDSVKIVVK